MTRSPVPIALIGLGAVASSHIAAYLELPQVRIVAVVDPHAQRANDIAARLGVRAFTDCAQMLHEVRPFIACVLSSVASHRSITEMLAAAGVHVLCEKPMANSVEDALAMRQACQLNRVELMYASSYRFLPAVVRARELIASGAIGAIRLIEERGVAGGGADQFKPIASTHYPVGTPGGGGLGLVDHGIHMLDVFPWLLGSAIRRVMGRGNYSGTPAHPEFAALEHDNGALGMLTYDESTVSSDLPSEGVISRGCSWKNGRGFVDGNGEWTPSGSSIRVHGTRGALRIFHYANRLFLCLPAGVEEIDVQGAAAPQHFGRQLAAFVNALAESRPAPLGADAGISALKALQALYQSARLGSWILIE